MVEINIPNSINEVWGPKRLTRYEKARILSARSLQLSLGAPPFIDISKFKVSDPVHIARIELESMVLPITIARKITGKGKQLVPVSWLIAAERDSKPKF